MYYQLNESIVKIVIMALLWLYTRMIPCRHKKVIIFKNNLVRHRLLFCKKYVTGQADEWMDGKAVLRIAFAFNKARKEYRLSSTFSCVSSECYSGFIKNVVFGSLFYFIFFMWDPHSGNPLFMAT